MSVTIPNYDLDFRKAISSNSTIYDNISNITAIYGSNVSSTTTNGLAINGNGGAGVDDVTLPNNLSFSSSYSIEFYVRLNSNSNYGGICSFKQSSGNEIVIDMYSTQKKLRFYLWSGGGSSSKFASHGQGTHDGTIMTVDGSTYHHMVCLYNNSTQQAEYYQDGVRVWYQSGISIDESKFPIVSSTTSAIGDINLGPNFNMKYFRIWTNHALSANEITTLYDNRDTANYISTFITLTIPTHEWDFRQTVSAGGTIGDNISGTTATLTGVAADSTNGAAFTDSNHTDYIALTPFNTGTEFSMEFYFQKLTFTSSNWPVLIHMSDSQTGFSPNFCYFQHDKTNNDLQTSFNSNSSNGIDDSTNLVMADNDYVHFVVTWNDTSKELKHYLNGSLVETVTLSSLSFTDATYTYNYLGNNTNLASKGYNANFYYFRYWKNGVLSSLEAQALYTNRAITNYFSFANLRINYGDFYLGQNLVKTIEDYKNENIPLHDISFTAFPANKLKETYIQGPVDISGDLIVRSDNNVFYDISAANIGFSTDLVTPKVITNDLSLNNRFFVGGDASFNGNVTIQGDLSLGSTISLSSTIPNSAVNVGSTGANTFTNDVSLNANLAIHGKTTVKNDLYLNAYTDVSANPVLSDGTYLKNMKMDKLNHRYIMDISRSAPFSTLTSNTLPSEIWDNSSNSGICVSADGKHIRTVNSGDLSSNALSYYSEDYGSSFHEDEELSQKLSQFDVSINSLDDYYATVVPGQSYTNEPEGTTGLWSGNGNINASFTHSSGTYTIATNSVLDNQSGSMYNIENVFSYSTGSTTNAGHAMNRTGWNSSVGTNLWRHSSTSLTAYDANNSATTYNGDYITVTTPYSFQMTQIGFANHWSGNLVNKFMIIGEDSTGTNRVLLTETNHNGSVGSFTTFTVSTTYMVNKFYLHITEINSSNRFTGIRKLRWNGTTPDTSTQELRPKFGSDKIFMSYNGQHQLVPKGVSNKLTYDDYLYVSNNFGKNWNLRKSSTLRTFNYTVTANGSSNYILNGETYTTEDQPAVNIGPNESVVFTIDTTTNGSHPFKIGTSSSGGEITDSRITSVTSGSNQIITFTPTSSGTFYYYCSAHSGMGNSIIVANSNVGIFTNGEAWFWNTGAVSADGKHMYVSGSNGFWKSSDYGRVWNQTSADSSFNFMSISADGKLVYGVNERKVYGSTDYGNTFSTLYTDSYTSDSSYCGISTSGNGKYLTIADGRSSDLYLSSDYGNSFTLHTPSESGTLSLNCGISHSGKIILNSNYISFDYGNNFTYVPDLISNQLTNNDTFYSKANMEYIIDASNNALLQIPYKSAIFQDIYSVGSIKVGSTTYSSDYRLKENIQPLTDNETVNELHPVKYYNTNLKKNDYGLLAHELQEKYPFLVSGEKDGAENQSINYNGLISLLVHEVKNLKKEYQELVEMKNNA